MNYDVCVYAAGVLASTSRIPGVAEHCCFLKEIEDAQKLRAAVGTALESASRPGLSEEERRRMLTLVVVGGGATGVEYVGELSDFLLDALTRLYPQLARFARVILVHSGPTLLPQFDPPLREKALATLQAKVDVEIMLNTRVERVNSPTSVTLKTSARTQLARQAPTLIVATSPPMSGTHPGALKWPRHVGRGDRPSELTERLNARLVDVRRPGRLTRRRGGRLGPPAGSQSIRGCEPWVHRQAASSRWATPPSAPGATAARSRRRLRSPRSRGARRASPQSRVRPHRRRPRALDACEVLSPPLSARRAPATSDDSSGYAAPSRRANSNSQPGAARLSWRRRGALASAGGRVAAPLGGGVDRLPAMAECVRRQAGLASDALPRALRLAQDEAVRARRDAMVNSILQLSNRWV